MWEGENHSLRQYSKPGSKGEDRTGDSYGMGRLEHVEVSALWPKLFTIRLNVEGPGECVIVTAVVNKC